MNRMVFAAVVLLLIGACLPTNLIPIATAQPTLDTSGLTQAVAQTNPTQSPTVQASDTAVTIIGTTAPPTASPLPSETETAAASPVPNLTTTPLTATAFTESPLFSTATLAVAPGAGTMTATPGVLIYGTMPPAVPFSSIRILNRAKADAYISLQVTTVQGGPTIIEYPVKGSLEFRAPTGFYLYVAWVGGNKMVGNFRLKENDDLTIILYKDRVTIK
jgi:hypothetical protein